MELENCNKDEIMQLTNRQKQISQQNTSHEAIDLKLDAKDRVEKLLCPWLFRFPDKADENIDNYDRVESWRTLSAPIGWVKKKNFFVRWRTSLNKSTVTVVLGYRNVRLREHETVMSAINEVKWTMVQVKSFLFGVKVRLNGEYMELTPLWADHT